MIRYLMTAAMLLPAFSQAQTYALLTDASLHRPSASHQDRCLADNLDTAAHTDSELVLQHRLSFEENTRFRTNLYVGILWSIVWGGATPYASSESIGHACNHRGVQ